MVKNDFRAINLILTTLLLISLVVISGYIIMKAFKKIQSKEMLSYEMFSEKKRLEELASVSIIYANESGFMIKNTGRISLDHLIVYLDNQTFILNESICKKYCVECSSDLSILEVNAEIVCNINLSGYRILTVVTDYAKDWKTIE